MTLDGGKEWKKFMTGLPSVRVDDILIHPRDRDLIIGTHGRSIWIADDISAARAAEADCDDKDVVLFDPRPAILWKNDPQAQRHATNRDFQAKNPQGGTAINIWAKSDLGTGKVEFLQGNNVVEHHGRGYQGGHESLPVGHARSGERGRDYGCGRPAADAAGRRGGGGCGGGSGRRAGGGAGDSRSAGAALRRQHASGSGAPEAAVQLAAAVVAAADVAAVKPACPSWRRADAAVAAAVVADSAAAPRTGRSSSPAPTWSGSPSATRS